MKKLKEFKATKSLFAITMASAMALSLSPVVADTNPEDNTKVESEITTVEEIASTGETEIPTTPVETAAGEIESPTAESETTTGETETMAGETETTTAMETTTEVEQLLEK